MKKGRLLLIPVPLGEAPIENSLVPALGEAIADMREFIVENERTARRFLKAMGIQTPLEELQFRVYGKHAKGSGTRSEEHTSELQSLMRISYAVLCLKKKIKHNT